MIINEGRPGKKLPTLTNPGVAGDLLSGKQLIGQDGNIITGTIPSKGSNNISVSGRTVTVPAGYYPSQARKSIASATQATPSITVSSGGLITASATQSAGYVASGTKSATKQLTTQAGKTVTPSTSQQTAVASGRYTTGAVYVAGDTNLKAANIKSGVSIFGVEGTLTGAKYVIGTAENIFSARAVSGDVEITANGRLLSSQNINKIIAMFFTTTFTEYYDGSAYCDSRSCTFALYDEALGDTFGIDFHGYMYSGGREDSINMNEMCKRSNSGNKYVFGGNQELSSPISIEDISISNYPAILIYE